MKKKFFAISIPLMISAVALTSCGGGKGGGGKTYESVYNVPGQNKTEITLKNFGGGIGRLWIDKAADRFAQKMMNRSFGEGKHGVYIKIENTYNEGTSTMDQNGADIYFDERESDITSLGQSGLLLNLDEIYDDETREGGKLRDKIFPNAVGSVTATVGGETHFYGLPHYEYYGGLSYNVAVFDEYFAYFAADDASADEVYPVKTKFGDARFIADEESKKSEGPDGEFGTEDDGLPRSVFEFLMLSDYLSTKCGDLSAFVISGQHARNYYDYLLGGLWANLAGTQQMKNYYDCKGTIEVVDRDASGNLKFTDETLFEGGDGDSKYTIKVPVTKEYTFTGDGKDGYIGNDMVAKYYALAIMDIMYNEGYFNRNSFSSDNHYEAQQNLMFYKVPKTNNYRPAAMLVDGSYWNNEANEQGSFTVYEEKSGKPISSLDCRFMPLPVTLKVEDGVPFEGRPQCLLDMGQSYAMINKNVESSVEKKTACVELMKFLYSQEELQAFTTLTGMPRMIDCGLTDDQKKNAGSFYEHMFKLRKDDGSNVLGLGSTSDYWLKIRSSVRIAMGKGPMLKDGKTVWLMLDGNRHAQEIFDFYSYTKEVWPTW